MTRYGSIAGVTSLLALMAALVPTTGSSTEAKDKSPCSVTAKAAGTMTHLELTDLEMLFPEIQVKAEKGVTVTLEHLIQVKIRDAFLAEYRFGCKVTFDLWKNRYSIVPTGSSSVKTTDFLSSIKTLPAACRSLLLPFDISILKNNSHRETEIEVLSKLDPVSEEQAEKTKIWLAERGIGSASPALLGRAVAALIDLKEDKAVKRSCHLNLAN